MTNEEWIKGLPTEAFMTFLNCKGCSHEMVDEELEKCFDEGNCEAIQLAWLKAERKE